MNGYILKGYLNFKLGESFAFRLFTSSVAQLHARPTGYQEVAGLTPPGRQHSFVEI